MYRTLKSVWLLKEQASAELAPGYEFYIDYVLTMFVLFCFVF